MKIYFAGSIRGGRDRQPFYERLVESLKFNGHEVLSEHVGSKHIGTEGEKLSSRQIFLRDIEWLQQADLVVADVTIPSLGVGFEICYAQQVLNKKTLCITNSLKPVSAMIEGNEIEFARYLNDDDLIGRVNRWIRHWEQIFRKDMK